MTTLPTQHGPALALQPRPRLPFISGPLQRAGRTLLLKALAQITDGGLTITDALGTVRSPNADATSPRVTVHNPAFYSAAAFGGSIGLAESYIDGQWDCDDLTGLVETVTRNTAAMQTVESRLSRLFAPLGSLAYWLERNNHAGSRANIAAHYDLGNDFFATFLDESMTYSSGVFDSPDDTLEQAQFNKIDRACRALQLTPDDHLLEIGTGWGALAVHAARHYGCRVTTTTISQNQFDAARARIDAAGIGERVTLVKTDYRDLRGTFDKVVSIEMVEAVGRKNIPVYFKAVSDRLAPHGAAFIQAITIRDQYFESAARTRDFLKKYIFPGSCLLSVKAIADAVAARTDLRIWGSTDLSDDYDRTLALWTARFNANAAAVSRMGFDDRFIRMWNFYFAYCRGAFRARHCGDVQMLLVKPGCRLPRFDLSLSGGTRRQECGSGTWQTPGRPASRGCPA